MTQEARDCSSSGWCSSDSFQVAPWTGVTSRWYQTPVVIWLLGASVATKLLPPSPKYHEMLQAQIKQQTEHFLNGSLGPEAAPLSLQSHRRGCSWIEPVFVNQKNNKLFFYSLFFLPFLTAVDVWLLCSAAYHNQSWLFWNLITQ